MKDSYKQIEKELLECEKKRTELVNRINKLYISEINEDLKVSNSEKLKIMGILSLKVPLYGYDYGKRFGSLDKYIEKLHSLYLKGITNKLPDEELSKGIEMFGKGFCGLGGGEQLALLSKDKGEVWELVAEKAGAELQVIIRKGI